MSEKKRTSITVDPDVYEFLKQPDVNQSGLINELVKQYRDNQDRQVAALELRVEHLEEEAKRDRENAQRKQQQAEEIRELLQDARQTEQTKLQEARNALENTPLKPDNPGVENWADKLDMSPTELIERLENTE